MQSLATTNDVSFASYKQNLLQIVVGYVIELIFFACRPMGDPKGALKMLLYDSLYDQYRGVICIMAVTDGMLKKGI